MAYRLLADVVVLAHALFVAFIVAGGLFVLRWRWVAFVHLPCAVYGALIVLVGWICPLTPLENHLRRLAGEVGHAGGFVEHYLVRLLYPDPYPDWLGWALGGVVAVVNGAVYALVIFRAKADAGTGEAPRG